MSSLNPSPRERLLLNVMPAAIVLAMYAFLFAMPAQKEYQNASRKLNLAKSIAVDETIAEQAKKNLELAQSGLVRLNEQIKSDREQIAFLGRQWSNGDARLTTVQQVTELLQQFNLSIVRQEFEEEPPLSVYLKDLETVVAKHSGENENLEYWQIELAGGYPDMMKFLLEVKSSGLRTFPVTLTMKASDTTDGVHTWTVVFVV